MTRSPWVFLVLTLLVTSLQAYTPKRLPTLRPIADFQEEEVGKMPTAFRTYPFQRGKAQKVYRIAAEGKNRFLKAVDAEDLSTQVFLRFYWTLDRWPHFSWRWRARTLPKEGDERKSATNDSACGVYVVFGNYTGEAIKYVWSTKAPVGTIIPKREDRFQILVKETGEKRQNQWQTITVNVAHDYQKLFGKKPDREPSGFGLLTDGNATHSPAACDYDDFQIAAEGKF